MSDTTSSVQSPVSEENPKTTSSAYEAQIAFWRTVTAILGGAEAMRSTALGGAIGKSPHSYYNLSEQHFAQLGGQRSGPQSPYLPRFPQETWLDYEIRRQYAPLTNVYADVSENLSSKPFSKKCELEDGTDPELVKLSVDVDGLGRSLHEFAGETFKAALDYALTWIFVDYTRVPEGVTLADERDMGARPYWVLVPVEKMLAVYSRFESGRETITHARIDETCVEVEGYEEQEVERVRVLDREVLLDDAGNFLGYGAATWKLWEKVESEIEVGGQWRDVSEWSVISSGVFTIGFVPLIPVILGRRSGATWRVDPPLRDLALMQVEEFQQESNLKSTSDLTAFPMLAGNGVTPQQDAGGAPISVPVGPRAVLFAPMGGDGRHGQWAYVEPAGSSLTFLMSKLEKLRTEMRDLGKQPLTSANLTVITTANVSAKAHSVCQAWALRLEEALEEAWRVTALWIGKKLEPKVRVHTDFGVEIGAETDKDSLLNAVAAGVLSPETVRSEWKRRGVLSDDFDEKMEQQRLAEHQMGQELQPETHIDPKTGMPVVVQPRPGVLNPPPAAPPPSLRPKTGALK